jgi:hypothetical protein
MKALGKHWARLAGRHMDETEVSIARLVGVVVFSDVLETIEPIPEDYRGCLDHEEVNGAELLDGWLLAVLCPDGGNENERHERKSSTSGNGSEKSASKH